MFSQRDVMAALGVLDAAHGVDSLDALPGAFAAALADTVPYDCLVWSDLRLTPRGGLDGGFAGFPGGVQLRDNETMGAYVLGHPLRRHMMPGGAPGHPIRWSDRLSRRQLRAVPYHADVADPMGAEYIASVTLTVSRRQVCCIGLARSSGDFSDRDMTLLSALWPRLTARTGCLGAGPPLSLTPREADVLSLIAEGLTNYQIARRLKVSKRTIDKHVEHILEKLGVSSRAAAVAVYAEAEPRRVMRIR
jgi:DNA-binding CsgD family transcriptional regulator